MKQPVLLLSLQQWRWPVGADSLHQCQIFYWLFQCWFQPGCCVQCLVDLRPQARWWQFAVLWCQALLNCCILKVSRIWHQKILSAKPISQCWELSHPDCFRHVDNSLAWLRCLGDGKKTFIRVVSIIKQIKMSFLKFYQNKWNTYSFYRSQFHLLHLSFLKPFLKPFSRYPP